MQTFNVEQAVHIATKLLKGLIQMLPLAHVVWNSRFNFYIHLAQFHSVRSILNRNLSECLEHKAKCNQNHTETMLVSFEFVFVSSDTSLVPTLWTCSAIRTLRLVQCIMINTAFKIVSRLIRKDLVIKISPRWKCIFILFKMFPPNKISHFRCTFCKVSVWFAYSCFSWCMPRTAGANTVLFKVKMVIIILCKYNISTA